MSDTAAEGAASVQAEDRQGLSEDLARLHAHLRRAIASQALDITQLARRSGLSRTTVHQALSDKEMRPPTQRTLVALIKALRLNEDTADELEQLRQRAASPANAKASTHGVETPGKWIGQWDPHDLEVHPAGTARGGTRRRLSDSATADTATARLSGYVHRAHDAVLADAVAQASEGESALVVLSGASSTGKTRACWEAVQPLAAENWHLWHPFDPTHAEAALGDLEQVAPHTVVWLNETQRYLGNERFGDRIAAALHALLTDPMRAPVLVLGTLWPEHTARYTAMPDLGPQIRSRGLVNSWPAVS